MKNCFIVHGSFGSSKENWFCWLQNELNKKNIQVFNLDYPTPKNQSFENWSLVLDKYKNQIKKDTIFVGHSIGCSFILKYLINNNLKVNMIILVSGFNNYKNIEEFDKINQSFFYKDVSKIKNNCKKIYAVYSQNDPYITFEALDDFASKIGAKKYVYENAGHFNEKSGYTKFEDLLKFF